MIIEQLIQMFVSIVLGFQSLFPITTPGQTDSKIYEAMEWVFGNLHKLDNFMPIDTFFQILGVVLTFEIIFLSFDLGVFIYKRIRG